MPLLIMKKGLELLENMLSFHTNLTSLASHPSFPTAAFPPSRSRRIPEESSTFLLTTVTSGKIVQLFTFNLLCGVNLGAATAMVVDADLYSARDVFDREEGEVVYLFVVLVRLDGEAACVGDTAVVDEAHGGAVVLAINVVFFLAAEPV